MYVSIYLLCCAVFWIRIKKSFIYGMHCHPLIIYAFWLYCDVKSLTLGTFVILCQQNHTLFYFVNILLISSVFLLFFHFFSRTSSLCYVVAEIYVNKFWGRKIQSSRSVLQFSICKDIYLNLFTINMHMCIISTYRHMYTGMYMYICLHVYIHMYTYIHICIHICKFENNRFSDCRFSL
jgi:hypothetical protein